MAKEKTEKTGWQKINAVAKKVLALSSADFAHAKAEAQSQMQYSHPLKMGTAAKVNAAGKRNHAIAEKLEELRSLIEQGKSF